MKALVRNSKVSTEEIHPKEIQKLLQKIEGTPEEPMIARLTLRSSVKRNSQVYRTTGMCLSFADPQACPDLRNHPYYRGAAGA